MDGAGMNWAGMNWAGMNWDQAFAFALTLPGTAPGTSYGQPAVIAGGRAKSRAFLSTGREPGSFHVRSPHPEKAVLIETDPDTFWQTPHYASWPGLLVRHATADPDRVRLVITRAWWDASTPAQRRAFGDRP